MRTATRRGSDILRVMDPAARRFKLRWRQRLLVEPSEKTQNPDPSVLPSAATPARRARLARVLGWLLAVLGVALVVLLLGPLYTELPKRLGLAAPLITIPTHACVAVSPLPGDVLCVANGAMYGFTIGFCLSWVGMVLASIMEYKLAESGSRSVGLDQRIRRGPQWLQRLPVQHPMFLILMRQVPVCGGHVVTVSAGIMRVPMRRFLWCTAVGVVPAALLMPAIGAGIVAMRAL